MPPIVPRKRLRDSSPAKKAKAQKTASQVGVGPRKATLYDELDASATPQSDRTSGTLLRGLDASDSDSSLTSLSEDEFEDVPQARKQLEESEDEDDIEFEDVEAPEKPIPDAPVTSGDLELTLHRDTRISLTNIYGDKKGATKRDRMVRNATHRVHVLSLLWHNAVRNSWICDIEVQAIMVSHLPPRLWEEVERWRRNSGLEQKPEPKQLTKVKGRSVKGKVKKGDGRKPRDWSEVAERLEEGAVNVSHGDPLFRMLQALVSWWKQRFRVTAPALRKWGYMSLERLDRLTKAFASEDHDPDRFGERLNLESFRQCAQACEGSRDVGTQLFTALLRGLSMEARMVSNLQSMGFGWNKLEDAELEKEDSQYTSQPTSEQPRDTESLKGSSKTQKSSKTKSNPLSENKRNTVKRTAQRKPTVIEDSDDELDIEYKDTDDESVVELSVTPRKPAKPARKFDQDLDYPHYWVEVLSPVTKKFVPVDPVVKGIVATNLELIESFEPRGAKADKSRQIMAYIVAYSPDGTAKDVTVRYLKRNVLPGRTKGNRVPVEKVPVYNRHGKVKRHELFDWFKTAMSGYRRGTKKSPITDIDELEDTTDLRPAVPEKKEVKEGEETLQYYKQSKEYVLERYFKREEALKFGAKPVKVFKSKGKGGKVEEEDVFLRSDVLQVKSAETWHKQGRAPLSGERPLKRVPYRAATTNRRREIMEAEAATGQKVLQGLFSHEQTDWIIPPPIKDGIIPKNEYGNIDLFAEHMCPEGASHIPYRGAIRVCKRLGVDFAEAVVGFEFGHRMAVPVIQGVVIAEENHDQVMEELEKDEIERLRKEDEKRRKAALSQWRKFLMGMRIAARLRQEYGEIDESISVFGHSRDNKLLLAQKFPAGDADGDMAGGFLPEGYEEEAEDEPPAYHTSSFFPAVEDDDDDDGDDGLVMENDQSNTLMATEARAESDAQLEEETLQVEVVESIGRAKVRAQNQRMNKNSPKPESTPTRRSTRTRRQVTMVGDLEEDEDDEDMEDV